MKWKRQIISRQVPGSSSAYSVSLESKAASKSLQKTVTIMNQEHRKAFLQVSIHIRHTFALPVLKPLTISHISTTKCSQSFTWSPSSEHLQLLQTSLRQTCSTETSAPYEVAPRQHPLAPCPPTLRAPSCGGVVGLGSCG